MKVSVVRVQGREGEAVWALEHRERSTTHKHPPSGNPASHPVHRREAMTTALRVSIATDNDTGTRAAQTLARIYQATPCIPIIARDIYNERASAVTSVLGNFSRIEYLLDVLRQGDFCVAYKVDCNSRLSHLFFSYNDVRSIYRENSDILLMDCTYRTNRFNMPLLNIVGVSGMNTTLHVAQVFLRGETKDDFLWALQQLKRWMRESDISLPAVVFVDRDLALLNALEEIFPGVPVLLCLWHVVKDVEIHGRKHACPPVLDLANSRPRTPKYKDSPLHRLFCDAFLAVVNARTEAEYASRRWEMHLICPVEAAYVDDVWLDIWRYRLVRCWTNSVTHFGVQATSRVEGYHATLKTWLGSSNADLLTIHQRLSHWWTQSVTTYWVSKSNAEVKVVTRLRGERFARVVRKIHQYALLKCVALSAEDHLLSWPCTGTYSRSTGLPCIHKLHAVTVLQPEDFHRHWWVHRDEAPSPAPSTVLEPERIRDRRAQRASARGAFRSSHTRGSGSTGTRRLPSGFEISIQDPLQLGGPPVHPYF